MSNKFVKKLKKDLKKSPGKAAMLALLSVVAIWFWAPLAMKLAGGTSEPAAALATLQTSATTTPSATVPPLQQTPTNWKQIAAAIDADPRMRPAERLVLARDPFLAVAPAKPEETTTAANSDPKPVPLDVPPANVGLVLSGTIVGPHRSVARMNGKSYAPGDVVRAPASQTPLSYRVLGVSGRSVTLALGEKQYELKMPRRRMGATDDAQGNSQAAVSSDSPDFDPSILEQLN